MRNSYFSLFISSPLFLFFYLFLFFHFSFNFLFLFLLSLFCFQFYSPLAIFAYLDHINLCLQTDISIGLSMLSRGLDPGELIVGLLKNFCTANIICREKSTRATSWTKTLKALNLPAMVVLASLK